MLTIVLVATVPLSGAALLLLSLGPHVRFAYPIGGLLLAAVVCYDSAEFAARMWNLVPPYASTGAGHAFAACATIVLVLPYWKPIGQRLLGSYLIAAGTFPTLAGYLTVASGPPVPPDRLRPAHRRRPPCRRRPPP